MSSTTTTGLPVATQRIDERLLVAGQIEMRAVLRFAALGFAFADDGDDEIAVARAALTAAAMRCVVAVDRLAFARRAATPSRMRDASCRACAASRALAECRRAR